jgi:ribosomal protein S18 acetylase RimI-like enzyme
VRSSLPIGPWFPDALATERRYGLADAQMLHGEVQHQTEDVVVRALRPNDVELFRSVRMQALEDSPDAYMETLEGARDCDWQTRTARLFLSDPPDRIAYVACVADLPVGMVFAGHRDHNDVPFLAAMWVHPEFRRRGVGQSLVEHALTFLCSAGQQHVSLWVTEAHAGVFQFYESLGFQLTGARSLLRPGSDTTILEMSRPLLTS